MPCPYRAADVGKPKPRALPWANMRRPYRAETRTLTERKQTNMRAIAGAILIYTALQATMVTLATPEIPGLIFLGFGIVLCIIGFRFLFAKDKPSP